MKENNIQYRVMKAFYKISMTAILIIICQAFSTKYIYASETQTSEIDSNANANKNDSDIKMLDIEISEYESEMYVGKSQNITATILPSDYVGDTIKYTSSDNNIIKVSSTGDVKALAKGEAVVTVSAGSIKKELSISVRVSTEGITLNSTFVVLKIGETYKLTSEVLPETANQNVTYTAVNSNVATVNVQGEIKAKSIGNTTVLVTNSECTTSVTVVVNNEYNTDKNDGLGNDEKTTDDNSVSDNNKIYNSTIFANEVNIVDEQWLLQLYHTKNTLRIHGDGYSLVVNGNDIINHKNVLKTNINLRKEGNKTTFTINEGNFLCGNISLELNLQDNSGKYVYLYNESKERYELLELDPTKIMIISTAGKYMVTSSKISIGTDWIIYILIIGAISIIGGTVAYIVAKKKHWFW